MEDQKCYYLIHSLGYYRNRTFTMGISPKVNEIAVLEFELVYYDVAAQHVSHHATKIEYA